MVIMAHPDDPEFSCGGTVALWARQGREIIYVLCTSGDKGSEDPAMTPQRLAEIREEEQRRAAQRLGVVEVVFLRFKDGELMPDLELRRAITRAIRRYQPDIAIIPDPARYYFGSSFVNHPDHRAVGEAALAAIYPAARDRLNFPELWEEGLQPHKVREVYLSGAREPDVWIDIGEVLSLKIEALREHRSQFADFSWVEGRLREPYRFPGQPEHIRYAEAFKHLSIS